MKMEAEARGIQEIHTKQALGYAQLVQAVGGDASKATQLMIADKIEDLIKVQLEAIKGIKIDEGYRMGRHEQGRDTRNGKLPFGHAEIHSADE